MSHYFEDKGPEIPAEAGDVDDPKFDPADDWLKTAVRPLQIEAMRQWLYGRFEDPAHETPYDSSEGGYQFIYGGPYDPSEVLHERFEEIVPFDVIDELAHDVYMNLGYQLAPVTSAEDFYDSVFTPDVKTRDVPYTSLCDRLNQTDDLLKIEIDGPTKQLIMQMAHSSVITALEVYLADTVLYWVSSDNSVLRNFIENTKGLKERALSLASIFERFDHLDEEVKKFLQEQIWHRLDKVKPMMEQGLGIELPEINELMQEILIRHDIVHRAGKDKDGNEVILSDAEVLRVRDKVNRFAKAIGEELNKRFPRMPF